MIFRLVRSILPFMVINKSGRCEIRLLCSLVLVWLLQEWFVKHFKFSIVYFKLRRFFAGFLFLLSVSILRGRWFWTLNYRDNLFWRLSVLRMEFLNLITYKFLICNIILVFTIVYGHSTELFEFMVFNESTNLHGVNLNTSLFGSSFNSF